MFPLDSTKVELVAQRCALRVLNVLVCLCGARKEVSLLSIRLRSATIYPKIELLSHPPTPGIPHIPRCRGLR
jgi:hypothetical protein